MIGGRIVNVIPEEGTLDQVEEDLLATASALPGYEVLGELGRGGMGVVYKARDRKLDRLVAVKMILSGTHAGADERARFQTEARSLAAVKHPNIVQIYEVGEHHDLAYLALEYLPGGSLAQRIARAPLEPRTAARLVDVLARAMHCAHQAGIVHRDLKPANILFAEDDTPRITDFGVAKPPGEASADPGVPTRIGPFMGTPSYMAPEQLQGDPAAVGPAADIYALGAILYESMTAQPPFRAVASVVMFYQVMYQEPPRPASLVPHVPADLETIALKCLAKEPEKRYASAGELADDLDRFLRNEPIRARRVSWSERAWKWARRRPAVAGLLAALMLVGMLGIAGILWQWSNAVSAKNIARWQHYRASISAASSALQLGNTLACRHALDSAPQEYRDWEWFHFHARLQNALAHLQGHDAPVEGARFSPDGARLVSWSSDGKLRLWDCKTWKPIATLDRHESGVQGVAFTPDGTRIVSASHSEICTWDARSGALLKSWAGPRDEFSLALTPDGTRLLAGDEKSQVARVWEVATGRLLAELKHPVPPAKVAVSPNGVWFAVGGGETVQLWDAQSYSFLRSFRVEKVGVQAIVFSPDSSRLATAWDFPDNNVRIHDVATAAMLFEAEGHQNRVTALKYSSNGALLASASTDQTVRLWSPTTGQLLAVLRGHTSHVRDVAFNAEGSRLVSASYDGTLRLWNTKTGECLAVLLGHTDRVNTAAFRPEGNLVASASDDGTVGLWLVEQLEQGGVLRGHKGYIYDVAVSPDGKRIASAAWDNTARLWHSDGAPPRILDPETRFMLSVAFSPDGRRLAAGSRDSRLWLWDVEKDRPPLEVRLPGKGVESLSFAPDGQRLAVALGNFFAKAPGGNPTVRLLDAATGKELAVLSGHTDDVLAVRFSPDGKRIASGGYDGTVRVWETVSARPIATLDGHASTVHGVAWSETAGLLASASADRTVRLWDARTLKLVKVLPHASTVYAVAFNPNGTRLAAGCEDNTIRLWDVKTREEVAELLGHTAYVHAVVFSPDGNRLVSGSGDHAVRIWDTLPATR
jgi:WD40 repeat protein/tRNA A-37 threonylcarbamoyl transferase component Bud32